MDPFFSVFPFKPFSRQLNYAQHTSFIQQDAANSLYSAATVLSNTICSGSNYHHSCGGGIGTFTLRNIIVARDLKLVNYRVQDIYGFVLYNAIMIASSSYFSTLCTFIAANSCNDSSTAICTKAPYKMMMAYRLLNCNFIMAKYHCDEFVDRHCHTSNKKRKYNKTKQSLKLEF